MKKIPVIVVLAILLIGSGVLYFLNSHEESNASEPSDSKAEVDASSSHQNVQDVAGASFTNDINAVYINRLNQVAVDDGMLDTDAAEHILEAEDFDSILARLRVKDNAATLSASEKYRMTLTQNLQLENSQMLVQGVACSTHYCLASVNGAKQDGDVFDAAVTVMADANPQAIKGIIMKTVKNQNANNAYSYRVIFSNSDKVTGIKMRR